MTIDSKTSVALLPSSRPIKSSEGSKADNAVLAPLVSVVVTNYNYGRFVDEAIRSVAAQQYEDWECVIVDDLSTDNSIEVIQQTLKQLNDARFAFLRLERNVGQLGAMKEAVKRCNGAFLAFLDADDVWLPEFLLEHVSAHLNPNFSAGVSVSDTHFIDEAGRALTATAPSVFKYRGDKQSDGVHLAMADALVYSPGRIRLPRSEKRVLRHVAPYIGGWHGAATSGMMFRSTLMPIVMPADAEAFRICADYPIYQLSHVISGTIVIEESLSLYRLHGKNGYSNFPWIGGAARLNDHDSSNARHNQHLLQHIYATKGEIERLCGPGHTRTIAKMFGGKIDDKVGEPKLRREIRRILRKLPLIRKKRVAAFVLAMVSVVLGV